MRIMKRWFALMLTISVALSDCGGITVLATEETTAVETPDSGNNEEDSQTGEDENTVSDEMPDDNEFITEDETELPALHIGQIKEGEELPYPDDSEFVYDLPVSFEMSDSVILFADYNMDTIFEQEEKGTLVWSILRGENGMEEGSASLVDEDDDWTGFEVVSDSPYFTMTENEDEESGYYKTVELAARDVVANEDYNYYIRAAYYFGTGEEKDEEFYAATTVPFLPNEDTDIDKTQDDASDEEEVDTDIIQDDISATEETDKDETQDDTSVTEESDIDKAPEDTDTENAIADETQEEVSALSENDDTQQDSQGAKESIGVMTLSAESVTLHSDDMLLVSATVVPENLSAEITWESDNTSVAAVTANDESDRNAVISAKAEGIAKITAKCGDDITASVSVKVVEADDDEVYDLSGDIWVDGFKKESDELVYTGEKITQEIRVYHKETLLKEKTDYTLSYKNNVNAAAYNTAKAPSVTITMKGQYSGSVTLYYTIKPMDINNVNIYKTGKDNANEDDADEDDIDEDNYSGYEQAVNYSKNLKIPNPVLTFGKKTLAANKDFVCDYSTLPANYKKGDSYREGEVYHYTVNGIGNFIGSFPMNLVIIKDKNRNFSSAKVTLDKKQYDYRGTALSKSDVKITELKVNNKILENYLYDYEVCANGIEGAYVMVYPTEIGMWDEGYHGCKKVNLKLVGDRNIGDAALGDKWKESITFSQAAVNEKGGIFQEEKTGVLTFGTEKEALTEGEDYTVKYSNAQKVGTVTVTFTGKGRYKGTLKKKYEIKPNNNLTLSWKNVKSKDGTLETAYQKGGAAPDFVLRDQNNNILKNKTDYTVKLTNNKNSGTTMSCEINGKGNYNGYKKTAQIKVTTGDISKATISVPDKPYSTKQDAWKSKVTIIDVNGKKLAAGKDYVKEPAYTIVGGGQTPQAGNTVSVTVSGMGSYEGSIIGSYRIYENSISKLKITIDAKEYTGKEIKLSSKDIHVYANSADAKNKKNELTESCYKIIEYKNNIKAGTAKVTLQGLGDYGGTITCSFKIQKKAYHKNSVKGITLDQTSLSISIVEKEKKALTATVIPEDSNNEITNPTVIWSTSNSKIATVETVTTNGNTVTGIITAKKEGSVTITAITQDGNKRAKCNVRVSVPVLKEAGQTIEGKAGDTYQLKFDEDVILETDDATGIKYESDNPDVVSVDNKGLLTMRKIGAATISVYMGECVQQCYAVVEVDEVDTTNRRVLTYEQPEGCVDDTQGINQLLRAYEWNPDAYDCVYIPEGVYHIDAKPTSKSFGGIVLTDNQNLVMSPDAKLMAIGNDSISSRVIYVFGRKNVTISGGQIVGERENHKGTKGEWGHGIDIVGCTNVYIRDMDISKCWGDGIYLGFYDGPNLCSSNITIKNCILHENRRNNLSITDASNVTIRHCQFNDAKGTDPQYGIDIEPNNGRPCKNIRIYDSTFTGNAKASMGIMTKASDIRLENCKLYGNFINWSGTKIVLKNTEIKGTVTDKTGGIKIEK